MNSPKDPLDQLFEQWKTPPSPDHLETEIWRRVVVEDRSESTLNWREQIEGWFARPSFAALFVISCVLAGLFLAEIRVAGLQNEKNAQLIQSYLHLIDPLVTAQNDSDVR